MHPRVCPRHERYLLCVGLRIYHRFKKRPCSQSSVVFTDLQEPWVDPIDVEKQRRRQELGLGAGGQGRPDFNAVPKKPGLLDPNCGKKDPNESYVGEAKASEVCNLQRGSSSLSFTHTLMFACMYPHSRMRHFLPIIGAQAKGEARVEESSCSGGPSLSSGPPDAILAGGQATHHVAGSPKKEGTCQVWKVSLYS